jgi:5-methylcytosine-specific restriction endonuclease McrA
VTLPRHCLDCGTLTRSGSRCPDCERANHNRAYGGAWRKISEAQRLRVPWCECLGECGRHASLCGTRWNLTTDHIKPHAHGGTARDGVITMCRSCNSAKGDRP